MAMSRIPKERIEFLTDQLARLVEQNPDFDVKDERDLRAIFRNTLQSSIQEEMDLEKEVLEMLRQHGQEIYQEGADFQMLLRKGKQALAKKKRMIL